MDCSYGACARHAANPATSNSSYVTSCANFGGGAFTLSGGAPASSIPPAGTQTTGSRGGGTDCRCAGGGLATSGAALTFKAGAGASGPPAIATTSEIATGSGAAGAMPTKCAGGGFATGVCEGSWHWTGAFCTVPSKCAGGGFATGGGAVCGGAFTFSTGTDPSCTLPAVGTAWWICAGGDLATGGGVCGAALTMRSAFGTGADTSSTPPAARTAC